MAVKIRLARRGRKNLPMYSIVVADARAKRDGRFIQKIGTYNPHTQPASIYLKNDLAVKWLLQGAQPTHTVHNILSSQGVLLKKHLQIGVQKGAITQTVADQRLAIWQSARENTASAFKRTQPQMLVQPSNPPLAQQDSTPTAEKINQQKEPNNQNPT